MDSSTSNDSAKPSGRMRYVLAACLAVIGIPISLLGLLGVFRILMAVANSVPLSDIVGPAITSGIITVIGLGLLSVAGKVFISGRRRAQLQEQHPEKPWMWREDWASGRIADTSRTAAVGLWAFAIIWSAFTFPLAAVIFRQQGFPPRQAAAWLVMIFPLVGIVFLLAAIRQTAARRKFGTSHLQLVTQPGVIGRQFRATIETNLKEAPVDGMEVAIRNIRRVTSGGNDSSITEHVIWQKTTTLPASRLTMGMNGVTVPVTFNIPFDAEPCDDSNSKDCVLWRVDVSAQLPGIDYSRDFEVPVFTTGTTPV